MGDWLVGFCNFLIKGLGAALSVILSILPSSPFKALDNSPIQQYLGWVNWIVPVYDIEVELAACCVSILVYYGYQIVMRWGKVIE